MKEPGHHRDPAHRLIAAGDPALEAPILLHGQTVAHHALHPLPVLGMEVTDKPLDTPLRERLRVAENLEVQSGAERVARHRVEFPIADLRRLQHQPQPRFAFPQRHLRPLALGNVARHFRGAGDLAGASLIGDTVTETSTRLPSLRIRTVSKCSALSPRLIWA